MDIAFGDPVLREAGLLSDTVGQTMRFFEITQFGWDGNIHILWSGEPRPQGGRG